MKMCHLDAQSAIFKSDANFGYGLQRFLLDHFKIVAICESRCEPWFEQAAVNTIVTIVERCQESASRDANGVAFVKIKRSLAELIPWDMRLEALHRWQGLDRLVARIESTGSGRTGTLEGPATQEDDDFRIRALSQGELRRQIDNTQQTAKWGVYLRAPQVYFDLLHQVGNRLALLRDVAPPARGSLTGNNEFYHFDDSKQERWQIEPEFLCPLLKSPGDSDRILVDQESLRLKVFICRLSKDELKAQGKLHALRYIEWGEQQVFTGGAQSGQTWPNGAEVRNRKPGWYALPAYRSYPAQLFFASAYGERHIHKYSRTPLIADKRLYFLSPVAGTDHEILAAVLNASLTTLMTELAGRVALGDGALELTVEDARDYLLVPDVRRISEDDQKAIVKAFQPLLERSLHKAVVEVTRSDRRMLDELVLRSLGLEPQKWLPQIYEGITTLITERMTLAQKRTQSRRTRPQKAALRVGDEVIKDLLPDGPKRFPDDFLSEPALEGGLRTIPLPALPLRLKGHFFGHEELVTEDGQSVRAANPHETRYILYAQANGEQVAQLPQKPVEVSRAVKEYEQYLRTLRANLQQAYFQRTLDRKAAERFAAEVWRQFKLPDPAA